MRAMCQPVRYYTCRECDRSVDQLISRCQRCTFGICPACLALRVTDTITTTVTPDSLALDTRSYWKTTCCGAYVCSKCPVSAERKCGRCNKVGCGLCADCMCSVCSTRLCKSCFAVGSDSLTPFTQCGTCYQSAPHAKRRLRLLDKAACWTCTIALLILAFFSLSPYLFDTPCSPWLLAVVLLLFLIACIFAGVLQYKIMNGTSLMKCPV